MREFCTYGSVGEAPGNRRFYPEPGLTRNYVSEYKQNEFDDLNQIEILDEFPSI